MGSTKFKRWLCGLIVLLVSVTAADAQTFAEWFSQKKTLIKYLTQQILALESLERDVRKGYTIATGGLGNIGGITNAEFGLHQNYFSSLKAVNPAVLHDPDFPAVTRYAQSISRNLNGLDRLDKDNQSYIRQVNDKVLQECNADLRELQMVADNGRNQMTDQQRISRLHQIHERMQDKYVFTRHWCNSVRLLVQQKKLDEQQVQTLKSAYGID
jgi:hypothetical protein